MCVYTNNLYTYVIYIYRREEVAGRGALMLRSLPISLCIQICTDVYVCVYIYIYVCTYVFIHIQCICVMYIYI